MPGHLTPGGFGTKKKIHKPAEQYQGILLLKLSELSVIFTVTGWARDPRLAEIGLIISAALNNDLEVIISHTQQAAVERLE